MPSKFDIVEDLTIELAAGRAGVPLQDLILLRAINYVSNGALQVARAGLKPYGLTDWSFRTLAMLPSAADETPRPVSMADLGLITGESGPNLTRICDELVKAGLAVRKQSPHDRRKVFLALTSLGEAAIEETAPDMWGLLQWFMQILTEEEKAVMTSLLKRLADRMEQLPNREASDDIA
jgi:DNA-binding MarR family transcriptional regulator